MKRVSLEVKVSEINDKGVILKDKENKKYVWYSKNKDNYFTKVNTNDWIEVKASLFKHSKYKYLMVRNIRINKKRV